MTTATTRTSRFRRRAAPLAIAAMVLACGDAVAAKTSLVLGMGIEPAKIPHLFELFSQLDTTLDRSAGGLGIGLALVRRLVELHGGTVAAASQGPGKGSTFTVRLPA